MGRITVPSHLPSTDGVTLALHDLGGDGPLLLLAHATGFCGPMWAPAAEILAPHFHCVAFDFRAHGASGRPDRPLVWQGMAADVVAVVDALSPDQPVSAVGHSMGGAALMLAEAARPGTVARAWTFEPILFPSSPDLVGPQPSEISEGARRRRATFGSRQEVYERYRSRPPLDVLDERVLQLYLDHGFERQADGSMVLRCRPEDEAGVFEHHFSGAAQAAAQLSIPAVVAVGEGEARPVEAARQAAATNPGLELVVYEELTHFGPLQAPERLATDMLAWLSAPDGPG